jgi:hypothetical protein
VVEPDVVGPDDVGRDGVGRGVVEPDVVGPDVVGPDVVGPDVVEPDDAGRGDAALGTLIFWPTYTHELMDTPLAMARRCVVIPWRIAMRINVSPGRTMYVPLSVAGTGADVVGLDVAGLAGDWPGMRSLWPAYNHAFWPRLLVAANWLTLTP